MSNMSYVRSEMLPERAPPASSVGVIGWMRANLFSSVMNTVLSLASLAFVIWVLSAFLGWAVSPTWSGTSVNNCRELSGGGHVACWGVIRERWVQLLFGFYPPEEYWRPILAFALLFVAVTPVLFSMISRRMNWVLLCLVLGVAGLYLGGLVGMIWVAP